MMKVSAVVGAGLPTLIDTAPGPSVVARPRAAAYARRTRVYVCDGERVWDASLREFLGRGVEGAGEILLPMNAPAPIRAHILTAGTPVMLVRPQLLPRGASPQEVLQAMLALPGDRLVPATEDDEAIAVLTLLYRRHQAISDEVCRHRHWADAVEKEWPPALRAVAGRWAGSSLPALAAERDAMWRALRRFMEVHLPDLLEVVAPEGPRGRGVGPASAAAVITHIAHPLRFPSVRALHHYAGLGTRDGMAVRKRRGEVAPFNPHFKDALWELVRMGWGTETAESSYWKAMYVCEYRRCEENHARSCTNARCTGTRHVQAMAWRKVLQRYLAEVYVGWRGLLRRKGVIL
jgi:hypothetical protein